MSTPPGGTPYDYFTRLADSFLQGKTYLSDNPPWLNELIDIGGKYYVVYPPMPAIVAMPFRLISSSFPQHFLSILLGAGTVALSVKLSLLIAEEKIKNHIWIGLFSGASTGLWFLSSQGSSWYLGQVTAAFFLVAALVSVYKQHSLLTGVLLGAAYLSRIHTILALPLFLFLIWRSKKNIKEILILGIGVAPFVIFNFLYNLSRFGVIWDKGYTLIPGVLEEPWYQLGIIHPSYITRHLEVIFTSLPVFQSEFPFAMPSWGGLALWITTPALIFSVFAPFKNKVVLFTWIAIALVSAPILMHGTTGFAQFGYRFFVDVMPMFILVMLISISKTGLKKIHWILLLVGILVNLWGVLLISKLNWVVV